MLCQQAFKVFPSRDLFRGFLVFLYFYFIYKALIFLSLLFVIVKSFIRLAINTKLTTFWKSYLIEQLFNNRIKPNLFL